MNDDEFFAAVVRPTFLAVDNRCEYHLDNCRALAWRMREIALRSLLLKFAAKY